MRNVMQEQDVTDWKARLAAYVPETEQERRDRNEILLAAEQYGTQLLWRSHAESHFTCSGFVMDTRLEKVLMVYHRIYDSFAWTGGHADGSNDFLWTAVREAKEETGIRKPYPSPALFCPWTFSRSGRTRKRHTRSGTPALQRDLRADCRYQRDAAHRPGRKHRRGLDPRGKAAGDLQRTSYAPGV